MTYFEVAQVLENFITDRGGKWDSDDYTSAVEFHDPYLKNVQMRMIGLSTDFPPLAKGHYCNAEGIRLIQSYIAELRAKAQLQAQGTQREAEST